jgi:hypothetical protein
MQRRTIVALAAVAVAVLANPASDAQARSFKRGYHGFHGGPVVYRGAFIRHRPAFVHRRVFVRRAPIVIASGFPVGSCWRWVPTALGWRQIWVCRPYWAYRPFYPPFVGIY